MRRAIAVAVAILGCAGVQAQALDTKSTEAFVKLALECVHREYPNKIAHVLSSDADAKPPRQLTPAFFGCYDWHSSVHGHWLLVRALRLFPKAPFAAPARAALATSLTAQNIEAEVAYLRGPGRVSFERPYGLAWLLQLAAELRAWEDPQARLWSSALEPLEQEAVVRLLDWLPRLRYPIREGEHDQTAFAFGLIWDWASVTRYGPMMGLLHDKSGEFYERDLACPLSYEPSGQDFLSPCLAEADFMRRVMDAKRYSVWLTTFLPQIPRDGTVAWLAPAEVTDRSDPKLAHLDGLNLSRAWMLEGIARGLPSKDPRVKSLRALGAQHRAAALPAVTSEHYVGSHWLGTFALYGALLH